MIDREKVINALKRCVDGCDSECPYEYGGAVTLEYCRSDLMRDALELLKEQEPAKIVKQVEEREWNVCGNCGNHMIHKWVYCPNCGKMVKWND